MILYSNDCPKCKVLKAKLDEKNLTYDISDDFTFLLQYGFSSLPVLEVDEQFYNFAEAVKLLKERY